MQKPSFITGSLAAPLPAQEVEDLDLSTELLALQLRMNPLHLRQRRGIESEGEAPIFGQGLTFFHPENWFSSHRLLRLLLRCSGLQRRGERNCLDIRIRHNRFLLPGLPCSFDGYRILQLSDLHIDHSERFMHRLCETVQQLDYDLCVLTGDYRYLTSGPYKTALRGMERLRLFLKDPVYAVLGNHDSVEMVPALEAMGYRLLLNESVCLQRGTSSVYLAGIDDPHFFRTDNLEKASMSIPEQAFSLLLSHSPEIYKQACYSGFDILLCGHTHGGQICLPGALPLTFNAACPRKFCRGSWSYQQLLGYTSAGAGSSILRARFNCPPEITLHHLSRT